MMVQKVGLAEMLPTDVTVLTEPYSLAVSVLQFWWSGNTLLAKPEHVSFSYIEM